MCIYIYIYTCICICVILVYIRSCYLMAVLISALRPSILSPPPLVAQV